ncbi:LuxR family transcriptional regulator [Streptomyces sp. A3M-1-3]|uniref:LuxR C-terminal-related transcriptional regulator n=1 Tax=Streptomyces sp. A3M-1-3 TaxID=2962044 RepID=UPI0020B7A149|nr:LuxR C-terminal-related transcriptional regulator [Streptomyces sp. A3M-1-3]MCP3822401.1 LuxR family transcriptional regulator [Streptomyces sp. A3M-1-3]
MDLRSLRALIAEREDAEELCRGADRINDLTDQEAAVFALLHTAPSNEEIARDLHISERTVKFHIANLRKKLGEVSRLQLCLLAALTQLTDHPEHTDH